MIFNYWGLDWYIYSIYLGLFIMLYNFNWSRSGMLRYSDKIKHNKMLSRTMYIEYKGINRLIHFALNQLISYILIMLFVLLTYYNGYTISYSNIQFHMYNLNWYYSICIMILFIICFYSFRDIYKHKTNIMELRYAMILLFLTFICFINLNNLFVLLFLIECQGSCIIYFLIHADTTTKSYSKSLVNDMYKIINNRHLHQLNMLFIQFWVAFISIVLLTIVILRMSTIYGTLNWTELNCLSYYYLLKSSFMQSNLFLFIGVLFFTGFFLKTGMFPYFFWKPKLYENINLWSMMWYLVTLTFVYIFFVIVVCSFWTSVAITSWKVFLYWTQIIGLIFLINIIYTIVEIRVLLTYLSVFHMAYIMIFIVIDKHSTATAALNYLIMYIFIIIYFFYILFTISNKELKFVTDLHILEQVYILKILFVIAMITMGGVPPFISFWLKVSLITNLVVTNNILIAIFILGSAMYLMFFYLQLYRFINSTKFTWSYITVNIILQYQYIYILVVGSCIIASIYFVFLNDIFNWINLLEVLNLTKW